MDIFSIVAIAVLLTTTMASTIIAIVLKVKSLKLVSVISQLLLDKGILSEELDRLSFAIQNNPALENDFIKFLSESRDSAYNYIEQVQEAIQALDMAMQLDNPEQIDSSYKELIKFLPSQNSDVVE